MRIVIAGVLSALVLFLPAAYAAPAQPKTDDQKTLYALGLAISQSLGTFNLTAAELDMVKSGLTDGVLKKKPQVDIQTYGPKIQQLQQSRLAAVADKEKKAGQAFATKAAAEKGARKSDSGLVIIPLKEGTGDAPKATDIVKVHYHGTLTNGSVFDSSVQRNEPATFPLNQVVPCWTEGVQQIKVGGKARLVCPSNIAYGDGGRPPKIPPGATLVFEVELLEIMKQEAPAQPPQPQK